MVFLDVLLSWHSCNVPAQEVGEIYTILFFNQLKWIRFLRLLTGKIGSSSRWFGWRWF